MGTNGHARKKFEACLGLCRLVGPCLAPLSHPFRRPLAGSARWISPPSRVAALRKRFVGTRPGANRLPAICLYVKDLTPPPTIPLPHSRHDLHSTGNVKTKMAR